MVPISRSTMAWMSSCDGPLGPGFRLLPADEYSNRYFRCLSRLWNFSSVDGRIMTAARLRWRVLRNCDQKPIRNRSSAERLGARCRERLMISSCCFINRLSATMAFAPPGPRSLAIVVNRCRRSANRYFMGGKCGERWAHEQDCLSCRFPAIITNSPPSRRMTAQSIVCYY